MLITIQQVLTSEEIAQFRQHLAQANWQDGVKTAGTLARSAKQNLQLDDASELARSLGNHLLRTLAANSLFVSAALPNKIYPPKFNCYTQGGHYGTHVDSAIMHVPGTAVSLRSDLSATLFLSDAEDYEGGELEIETAFGVQVIKLAAGDMVLYPSSSLHRVTPVTTGARIASFFWIESLVGDEAERSMLFDLDQAIQALTPTVAPDDANLLKLTGVYHNLLRRWATT